MSVEDIISVVSFDVGFNCKFGAGICPGGCKVQNTIKSFLYYILRWQKEQLTFDLLNAYPCASL